VVIKESQVRLSIKKRCDALGVNRSSYYKWQKVKSCEVDFLEVEIAKTYHKFKGTYGRQRITQELKNRGFVINHKKVYRIMGKLGIQAVIRKKYCKRKYVKENIVENVLNRDFKADKPMRKLVCDVTELRRIKDKRYYLYSVMDLYSNTIIAANVSFHNDWGLVFNALKNVTLSDGETILHSDQGSQFTSRLYKELTTQRKFSLSMSRVGNCYDNAAKESFFGHFKEEFYIFYAPKTEEELYQNIDAFINYYNYDRIQMRFKMSPVQYLTSQNYSFYPQKKPPAFSTDGFFILST
jgi:transposase InsO family protein